MVQGYFRYVSADDETKFIGFRKIGRPLRYNRILKQDESCFNFRKRPTNSTSKILNKMPPLCVHNNNLGNNMNKLSSSINNNNRLKNATVSNRPKKRRRKLDKLIKNNLELSQTELSLVTSNSLSARKHHHSNTTNLYSSKINVHNKNQRNLVSKNTDKNIQNNYNENDNKFIGTTRHKFRHFNSRHHHAKRSPNQKGLKVEINP